MLGGRSSTPVDCIHPDQRLTGMLTQLQMFEQARRRIAALNSIFMELVNCKENPLTREDLEALIRKRPESYGRFSGFLDKLPSRASLNQADKVAAE